MPVTTPQINAITTGAIAVALTNAFIATIPIDLATETSPDNKPLVVTNLKFKLSAFYIYVTNIAAGATTLTIQVSSDAAGDKMLIPSTVATLNTGLTTATKGSIVLRADVDMSLVTDQIFITLKTDVGTCTLVELITLFDR